MLLGLFVPVGRKEGKDLLHFLGGLLKQRLDPLLVRLGHQRPAMHLVENVRFWRPDALWRRQVLERALPLP